MVQFSYIGATLSKVYIQFIYANNILCINNEESNCIVFSYDTKYSGGSQICENLITNTQKICVFMKITNKFGKMTIMALLFFFYYLMLVL